MGLLRILPLLCLLAAHKCNGEFLRVSGQTLMYGADRVFLSGVNIAWKSYGYDFGNGNYGGSGPTLEQWIRDITNAGGNTLRKNLMHISSKIIIYTYNVLCKQ